MAKAKPYSMTPSDQGALEDQATGGDDGDPKGLEGGFEQLYAMIQKQMQVQDREACKQEQRWRSVQEQLNQVRNEMDVDRRGAVRASTEPDGPEEKGASLGASSC